ncbi:ATP-binding protein [Saccharopolyspora antimicrobica]|uniref:ATP-binding protein n=1 Tax=Saccharopolyspora antimicrobica TaxID=455193 RepID=UPI0014775A3E|nr:ATP-binding protein [Saccharopolyspora antimicrobica]
MSSEAAGLVCEDDQRGIPATGLGMATVKSIVEAHGGTVTATTAEGGGSAFTVTH